MFPTARPAIFAAMAALSLQAPAVHADIYTWTDKSGVMNVSNEPPPEGVRVDKVLHVKPHESPPPFEADDAAHRAEIASLSEQVRQLQDQVQAASVPRPPFAVPVPMPVSAPAPQVVYVPEAAPEPSYGNGYGCDTLWAGCINSWGNWFATPFVVVTAPDGRRHRFHGRMGNLPPASGGPVLPLGPNPKPVIPLPMHAKASMRR